MTPTTFYQYNLSMPHPSAGNDLGYGSSSYFNRRNNHTTQTQRGPSPSSIIKQEIVPTPSVSFTQNLKPSLSFTETFGRTKFSWEERHKSSLDVKLPKLELSFSTERTNKLDLDYVWKKKRFWWEDI